MTDTTVEETSEQAAPREEKVTPRLKTRYREEILPALRSDRMWEFLDRLLSLALPRIRDFRGLSPRQFDGRGNYTFGLTEQVMFHEINQDRIDRSRGMDITVVTTATDDDQGRALLKQLGFPFREN